MALPHDEQPIFFLHVSSAGGTALCRWAQTQPCSRVPACGANCNLGCRHPWDWRSSCRLPACLPVPTACRAAFRPGCSGLLRYVRRRNLTFLASETFLSEHCFGELKYVTVVRDPVERLRSQLERRFRLPNAWLNAILGQPYAFNTSEPTSLMGTAAIDNYFTRILCGPQAFFLPLGGINASHLRAATSVLASFFVAIPLENLSGTGADYLAANVGWRGAITLTNRHSGPAAAAARRRAALARVSTRMQVRRHAQGASDEGLASRPGRRLSKHMPHGSAIGQPLGAKSLRRLRELNRYDRELVHAARARFAAQYRSHMLGSASRTRERAPAAAAAPVSQWCRPQQCTQPRKGVGAASRISAAAN